MSWFYCDLYGPTCCLQIMGGVEMEPYEDMSETVERAGLANLTSLMANVCEMNEDLDCV